ncbi:MAG: glycosyltransferase family 39 protein [Thermoanaerobaculia bacterium]
MSAAANSLESTTLSRVERRSLIAWFLLGCLAIFCQLASRALYEPDEGRNAEVMREMAVSGDYLVPHLDGLLFLDKPFLHYAAGGLLMKLLGATELAARLPAVLCTLALGFLVGRLAARWWGPRSGWLAGIGATLAPLPILYTQIVIFDAMLALWIGVALIAFYLALESPADAERGVAPEAGRPPRFWSAIAWIAMGLGTVTKGPVALLIPLAVALPWALWQRRGRRLVAGGAPLYGLALIAAWVAAVSRADPSFLHYALVTETLSRLTSNELKRDAPFWFYLPVALLGALPWSIVPLVGWRRLAGAWRAREASICFLLLWFLVPFLLFSAMHSKRVHYILPLVPALVLLSIWLWRETPSGQRLPGVRAASTIALVLGAAFVAVGGGLVPRLLARLEGVSPQTAARIALELGAAWSVAGLVGMFSSRIPLRAFCALTSPVLALLLLSKPLADPLDEHRSSRELARSVAEVAPAGSEIVAIELFPASLPFYLQRDVTVVSGDGEPLRSNYILRRYDRMIGTAAAHASLRPPQWLAGAIADCATPRLFLVRRNPQEPAPVSAASAALIASGRLAQEAGRDLTMYGACPAEAVRVGG